MDFEKIAGRFQQRLAETVARYEADIIVLQTNYEAQVEELQAKITELSGDKDSEPVEQVVSEKPTSKK